MPARNSALDTHDLAEISRSADESSHYVLRLPSAAQLDRYVNPPSTTPYGLEYAFYLLGNVQGKTVLDLGCGTGENLVPLARRGAQVVGLDISPELISWAKKRIDATGVKADLRIGSAYETGLSDESFDVIFCTALIHHLDIPRVRNEMARIVKKGGFIILSEPVRFSQAVARFRRMLRTPSNISAHEHPLTRSEFDCMTNGFVAEGLRYFRLPFVPLVERVSGRPNHFARALSAWFVDHVPAVQSFVTGVVVRLRKA